MFEDDNLKVDYADLAYKNGRENSQEFTKKLNSGGNDRGNKPPQHGTR